MSNNNKDNKDNKGNKSINKILILGDSFIGPFSLIKDKRLILKKFKGGTLKGIIKENGDNHKQMMNLINKHKTQLDGIIFFFGSVDIHFSYYYNYLNNKSVNNSITEIIKIVKSYYDMIKNIKDTLPSTVKITIINPFLNPVKKDLKLVITQLLNYRIITDNDLTENNMKIINEKYKLANKFFFSYSKQLQNMANIYKDTNIYYINFIKETSNNSNNYKIATIKPYFKDFSVTNIHLLYKPVLLLFINKILDNIYDIKYSKKQIDYFLKDENKYIKMKRNEINKLFNKSEKDLKAMYTGEEGQIDYYTANKQINAFITKYKLQPKTLKSSSHNKNNKSINKTKKTSKI